MRLIRLVVLSGMLCGLSSNLFAQELKPGRLPSDVRKSLVPGVLVEYFANDGKLLDANVVRLPPLYLKSGEPVTPFVHDRKIKIRFSGFIKLKLKGAYEFSLVGNGKIVFKVNDKELFNETGEFNKQAAVNLDLVKGYNRFEVQYFPPESEAAKLRIYWQNDSFEKEPIPSTVFLNSANENCQDQSPALAARIEKWNQAHQGRDLVLNHHCLQCHRIQSLAGVFAERDAPDLRMAAGRLNKSWLEDWLADPSQMRNSITMPRMLDSSDKQSIADLAAYVLSLGDDKANDEKPGDITKGGDAFENVGCIGCHHFEKPDFEDEYERVSLFYSSAKFKSGKLAEFLNDSRAHYKWSRMPKFRLTNSQCKNLEAFIRAESKGQTKGAQVKSNDVERGKKVFIQTGCANCHPVIKTGRLEDIAKAKPFDQLSPLNGCLSTMSNQTLRSVPRFGFDEYQLESIREFLNSKSIHSFSNVNRSYFTTRSIVEMRCTTCHDLDDEQATLPYIIEEEGVVGLAPNRVPMLTYAGEKLLPQWSVDLISGDLPYRVREHFRVQMPGFPARAPIVAHGLSMIHGFESSEKSPLATDPESAKQGQAVAAMETGLSCNRCHAIADKKPNAAFDAQSTNLVYAAKRLRKEYYMRWMFDPIRIDKQTKMPRFSEDRNSTSLKTVFDGDARKQFDALWQYLNRIKAD